MKNSKGKTMKAIMSHPGSMKMLRDAIKSPIGSTSRSQAQKIFRIMDKLYTANDGVGGPGMMMQQQQDALQSLSAPNNTFKDPQGIIVFHKLPPMKVDFSGKKKKAVYGGMGGPAAGIGFKAEAGNFKSLAQTCRQRFGSILPTMVDVVKPVISFQEIFGSCNPP